MHQFDLHGRRAVVTGAAQGFGRAIAERLLRSGARVSLWDCDTAVLPVAARGLAALGEAHSATVDGAQGGQVRPGTAATRESCGGVRILCANPGVSGPKLPQ